MAGPLMSTELDCKEFTPCCTYTPYQASSSKREGMLKKAASGMGVSEMMVVLALSFLVTVPATAQNLVLTPVVPADVGRHPEALTIGGSMWPR